MNQWKKKQKQEIYIGKRYISQLTNYIKSLYIVYMYVCIYLYLHITCQYIHKYNLKS